MFRIGEFSSLVHVSARMLRYYEKCGLLSPEEIDNFTGYRLYSAKQISLVSRIVMLRDMGFNVEEIRAALVHFESNNTREIEQLLYNKSLEIQKSIDAEHDKLNMIADVIGEFKKERVNMVFDVELKELPAVKVLSFRKIVSAYDKEGELWGELMGFVYQNKIACGEGGYSIYHDGDKKDDDVDIEIAMPVLELGISQGDYIFKELEAIPQAATVRFSGSYYGYSAAMEKVATWMETNSYGFAGLVRGLAVVSMTEAKSEDDLLTEIQIPVRKI